MSFEPVVDPGDVDGGLVAHGELVVAGGQGSVVLDVTEAAFHGVTVFVRHGVEGRWACLWLDGGPSGQP